MSDTYAKPGKSTDAAETELMHLELANRPTLTWCVHPAKLHPQRIPLFCAVLLLGATCGYGIFHQALPALSAALILLFSGNEYLLPQEYRIDRNGLTVKSLISHTKWDWSHISSWKEYKDGAAVKRNGSHYLSDTVTLLTNPRGNGPSRKDVCCLLREYLPELECSSNRSNIHAAL